MRSVFKHLLNPITASARLPRPSRLYPAIDKLTYRRQTQTMADDASYQSFLSKANEPVSAAGQQEATSTSSSRGKFDPTKTSSLDAAPKPIAVLLSSSQPPQYTSETDADFEPFFASYSGNSLPSAADFAKSLGTAGADGTVEELKLGEFDARGQYKNVVEAVKASGDQGAGVKVYRLEVSSTRSVYFIVTLAEKGAKLVGVKAESVES